MDCKSHAEKKDCMAFSVAKKGGEKMKMIYVSDIKEQMCMIFVPKDVCIVTSDGRKLFEGYHAINKNLAYKVLRKVD